MLSEEHASLKCIEAHGEVYSIQHHVIKFVSDLWQVGGFLRILLFPPPIKLHGIAEKLLSWH
jgi:hypothetical protein